MTYTHSEAQNYTELHLEFVAFSITHIRYYTCRSTCSIPGRTRVSAAGVGLPSTGPAAKAAIGGRKVVVELQTPPGISGIHIGVS